MLPFVPTWSSASSFSMVVVADEKLREANPRSAADVIVDHSPSYRL
jgi:hypothetical protein